MSVEHLAIMKKGYIEKILSGEKTIESRFSVNKIPPYGKAAEGDKVFLAEAGKPITAMFKIGRVLYYDGLDSEAVGKIAAEYGGAICADDEFWRVKSGSRFATLMFVTDAVPVTPFRVYKSDRSAFKSVGAIETDLLLTKKKIIKHPCDCAHGRHYFERTADGTRCITCGAEFLYAAEMSRQPSYGRVEEIMDISEWNRGWLTAELDNVAAAHLDISHGDIMKRLKSSVYRTPKNDGRQTPYYCSVIYYAQHALGCCCRKCIEKFYGIPRDRLLTNGEMEYFTYLIEQYIKKRILSDGVLERN